MDHLYCHSSSSDSSNSVVYHLQNNHHHPAVGPPISATNSNNFIIMTAANQTSTQAAAVAAATTSSSIQPQLASASSVNSANHHHHNQRYSSGGGLIISGGSVGSGVDNPSVDATPATAFNKQLKSMLLLNLDLIQEQSDMLLAKDKQITALKQENDLLKVKLERLERRILRSQNTLSPQLQQQQQQQQQHQSSAYAITSPGQKQLSQQQQPQKQTGDNLRLVQANGENLVPVKSESDSDVEGEDEEDEEGQQLQCLVDDKLNVISPKLVPEYVNNSCSSSGSASNNKVPVVEQQQHHHHQVAASETESTPVKMPPSGNRNSIKADHPQNKGTIKSYLTSLRPKASTASSTPASISPTNSSSSNNNNNNNNSTVVTLQSTKSNGYSIKSRASPYKRDENSLPKVANNSNNKLKNCTTPDANAVPITRHFARVSPPNRQQPSAAAATSEVTAKADRHVQLDDNVLVLKIQPTTDDDDDDDPEDEVDNASGSDEHVKRELKVQPLAVDDENDSSEKTIAGTANYDNNNSAVKQKRSETVANNCGAKVMLKRQDAVVNASTSGGVGTTAMKRRSTTSESSSSVYTYRRGRKLARSMYTHKLYVTRHWEEVEQEEDPNSLAVAELKRNCNNNNNTNNNNSDADGCGSLEVPSWRIVDGTISDDNDVESMDVDEDMSADAYLKRHSKYELDERRRKKWDVQRIREQRTIERLKRRQCKSEGIHLPDDDAATATGSGLNPMSLYPNASDIKYVETTEELPIQAFGEPVPNFAPFEFEPAWRDAARPSPRDNSKEENTTNGCSTSGGGSQIEFCPLAKYSTFALRRAQQLFVASSNAILANAGCSSAGSASGGGGGAGGGSTTTCRPFKFKRFKTKKK